MKSTRNNDATNGRTYGGDSGLIHVRDGERANVGRDFAARLTHEMRVQAVAEGRRTPAQGFGTSHNESTPDQFQSLCPGCFMTVGFNMLVYLAEQNGQDLRELGNTLGLAFLELANGTGDVHPESLHIEDREDAN